YLDNQAEREPAEVAEEFVGQFYSASPAMPRTIVVGPYLRDRVEVLAAALGERRGAPVEVRVAERGDKRRLRELAERNARLALDPHDRERDEGFASLPSLIVIDGGKGHLAAAIRALRPFVERGVTVIGLAKRLEEVFVPGRAAPVDLPADSEASKLLQRVRDE